MTSATPTLPGNPFVGPRPFRIGEQLFGRDRELRELRNLLVAERIVVLYSPSGAGKTSLVQARLIPRMRESGFHVRPVIRVNQPPRNGTDAESNRYLDSALRSLEIDRSKNGHAGAGDGRRFGEILATPPRAEDAPDGAVAELLIFDQFEEILTLDPTDGAVKTEFFRQVGEALRVEGRWALFSLREEYVAALDPYLRHIPTRLAAAYRLDLLSPAAAAEAIQKPAAQAGVDFTGPAAARLIEELVEVRGCLPDGTPTAAALPFVEPVQLQVVCTRFWGRLPWADLPAPNGRPRVEVGHVAELARVDDALGDYYDDRVAAIASDSAPEAPEVSERQIREWIDANLITDRGTRAQLRVGAERGQTLPERVVQALVDAYLIRREGRPGDRWFELAHDRMVQPITESNAAWLRAHLQPVQLQARHWHATGRRCESLLRGATLRQARAWTAANRDRLQGWEQSLLADYLDDSSREQQSRNLRFGAAVALVCLLLATGLWYWNDREQQALAQQEAHNNRIRAFLWEAQLQSARGEHQRGALLARQAFLLDEQAGSPLRDLVDETLRQALAVDSFDAAQVGGVLMGHEGDVTSVAFSVDGSRLASGSTDETIQIWDPAAADPSPVLLGEHPEAVTDIAVATDGRFLFSTGRDHGLRRWSIATGKEDPLTLAGSDRLFNAVAISPDGRWLAAGEEQGAVSFWDLATSNPSETVWRFAGSGRATRVAFSPDSRTLVFGGDLALAVIDLTRLTEASPHFEATPTWAVAVSPDGRWLAAATGVDGAVHLRNLADLGDAPQNLPSDAGNIRALAFSPDGRRLAAGGEDGVVRLWDLDHLERNPISLRGHAGAINAVAFSPDGHTLAAGGNDDSIRLWIVDTAALAEAVCDEVTRDLSEDEWRRAAGAAAYEPTCPDLPRGGMRRAQASRPAASPEQAAAGPGTPIASNTLFPETLSLPLGQPFRIEQTSSQTLEEMSKALSDSPDDVDDAAELLRTWGWEENANRHYASDDPPPNAAGYVVISVHDFASADGAAAALPYLADVRQAATSHNTVDVGRFGDQTRAMAGRGFNGNEVTVYAQRGSRIFRVIGVAGIGDPTRDVQTALQIMLDR